MNGKYHRGGSGLQRQRKEVEAEGKRWNTDRDVPRLVNEINAKNRTPTTPIYPERDEAIAIPRVRVPPAGFESGYWTGAGMGWVDRPAYPWLHPLSKTGGRTPHVTDVLTCYHTIPATSVDVERLFSRDHKFESQGNHHYPWVVPPPMGFILDPYLSDRCDPVILALTKSVVASPKSHLQLDDNNSIFRLSSNHTLGTTHTPLSWLSIPLEVRPNRSAEGEKTLKSVDGYQKSNPDDMNSSAQILVQFISWFWVDFSGVTPPVRLWSRDTTPCTVGWHTQYYLWVSLLWVHFGNVTPLLWVDIYACPIHHQVYIWIMSNQVVWIDFGDVIPPFWVDMHIPSTTKCIRKATQKIHTYLAPEPQKCHHYLYSVSWNWIDLGDINLLLWVAVQVPSITKYDCGSQTVQLSYCLSSLGHNQKHHPEFHVHLATETQKYHHYFCPQINWLWVDFGNVIPLLWVAMHLLCIIKCECGPWVVNLPYTLNPMGEHQESNPEIPPHFVSWLWVDFGNIIPLLWIDIHVPSITTCDSLNYWVIVTIAIMPL
ncbi:hypothetical protein BDN72DRAFT_855360 [Pluteus cervinus]|uniref:Uncharacterized protein n=1 Tax=Pluteus cervinus TaxID=181527 RepID=A0ACD3B3V3_9AGAR|nr:hypothetical protein BDN72DRAFT_855360 [Pluteus cervinus]